MQSSKYSYLTKNTLLFAISSFGPRFFSFFLVPLYTSMLSTSDYGTADLVSTTSSILIYIFTLNIAEAVLRFAIDRKSGREEILSIGLRVMLKGSFFVLAGIGICWIGNLIQWPSYCYLFLFMTYLMSALNQILLNYLRAIDQIVHLVIASLISSVCVLILNIFLLVGLKWGLLGFLISPVIAVVLSNLYAWKYIKKTTASIFVYSKRNQSEKKNMISYSVPLIFNSLAWWVNSSLDKYFVLTICGVAQNGIYAAASKIPTILTAFQNVFSQAWTLSAIKEFDQNDSDGFFGKMYTAYNASMVLCCSGLILINIPLAQVLFAKDFYVAWKYSSVLLLPVVFGAMNGYIGSVFAAVKDSKIFAVSTVSGAVANTCLNFLLIPRFGVQGAAVATAVSYVLIWVIRMVCVRKYIRLRINLIRDLFAYVLLVVQILLEHTTSHAYFGQILVLVVLVVLYHRQILLIINKMATIMQKKLK